MKGRFVAQQPGLPPLDRVAVLTSSSHRESRSVLADRSFCREEHLTWCEAHGVYYGVGLQKNPVLSGSRQPASADAE